jgi:hypothetical protein
VTTCDLHLCAGDVVNNNGKLECVAPADAPNADFVGACSADEMVEAGTKVETERRLGGEEGGNGGEL